MSRVDVASLWAATAQDLESHVPGKTAEALRLVQAWLDKEVQDAGLEQARAAQQHLATVGLSRAVDQLALDKMLQTARSGKHQFNDLALRLGWLASAPSQLNAADDLRWRRLVHTADAILSNALDPNYVSNLSAELDRFFEARLLDPEAGKDFRIPLFDRFEPVLLAHVYREIESHIKTNYASDWTTSDVPGHVRKWLQHDRMQVINDLALASTGRSNMQKHATDTAVMRFDYHIYRTLLALRNRELFDIIVDWPDSRPALVDLKACLAKVEGRRDLCNSLRESTRRRLLHPGADTKDILDHYIRTIRALRIVDPPGVLLAIVAEPVRGYLRGRLDAIRSIMTAMMDQESLWGDDRSDANALLSNEEEEDYRDPNLTWEPDPVDAPAQFRKDRNGDIVQMLTSIYDTKDVFVKEFQTLLAQRLLQIEDYDVGKEHRHVEILKKRFGETMLQNCEVMLKDMADSKRADHNVQERLSSLMLDTNADASDYPIHPLIVSRLFWPTLAATELALPERFARRLETYEAAFGKYKADKHLRWLSTLGSVKINLELEDRSFNKDVTVVQAAVVDLFSGTESLLYQEILAKFGGGQHDSIIRNALYFWANQGILRETTDNTWSVIENASQAPAAAAHHVIVETAPVATAQSEQVERLRMYWVYIQGMLTNLGVMPADRIHDMLSKFMPDFRGQSQEQLGLFLEQMQREGTVELVPGQGWKLTAQAV